MTSALRRDDLPEPSPAGAPTARSASQTSPSTSSPGTTLPGTTLPGPTLPSGSSSQGTSQGRPSPDPTLPGTSVPGTSVPGMSSAGTSSAGGAMPDGRPTTGRPYLTAVPDCEPPFDDDRSAFTRLLHARTAAVLRAGSTAVGRQVAQPMDDAVTGVPDTVTDAAVPGWCQDADMGVRRTGTAQLPPAARSGPVLARALVEVLCGQRALPQLRVHCAPEVFAGLENKPVLRGALGHLLTVRVCEPADGAAEVSVVFRRGQRVRALAFRMQGVDGRWRVTALQTA